MKRRIDTITLLALIAAGVLIAVCGVLGYGLAIAIGLARWLARGMKGA